MMTQQTKNDPFYKSTLYFGADDVYRKSFVDMNHFVFSDDSLAGMKNSITFHPKRSILMVTD